MIIVNLYVYYLQIGHVIELKKWSEIQTRQQNREKIGMKWDSQQNLRHFANYNWSFILSFTLIKKDWIVSGLTYYNHISNWFVVESLNFSLITFF